MRNPTHFWRRFFSNEEVLKLNLHKPQPLRPYLKALIGDKREVNIADIGSGPISWIGNICEGVKVNLFPSDITADAYKNLLKEFNIVTDVVVEKQDMEKLTYENNFFDIVYCSNALDHTVNPKVALYEMIRVCKVGGYVYLRHSPNEGQTQRYHGLHHWNICLDKEDCLFWERENKDNFHLSSIASGFINELKQDWEGWDVGGPSVVSILRKQ